MADEITGRDLIRRQLKRLREAQGLSIRQLADELTWSKSMIGDVESGHRLPKAELVAALDAYFRPVLSFAELLDNVRDALIAEHMKELLPHEKKAVRIQTFTSSVIPGLLQTPQYAWELSKAHMFGATDDVITARVALRLDRQEIFNREETPVIYRAVIDEAALARHVGPKSVMAEQLRKLLDIGTNHQDAVLIYPNDAPAHSMMGGSLSVWHLADGRTVALVESFGPGEPVENPSRVAVYCEMFDKARANALSDEASADLIRRYIKEYEND